MKSGKKESHPRTTVKLKQNMKTKESYSISLAIIDIAVSPSKEGQGLIAVFRQLIQTIQKEEDVLNA